MLKRLSCCVAVLLCATSVIAQSWTSGLTLGVDVSTTLSGGDYTPLWLSSNVYGVSSVSNAWGYQRLALKREIENDSLCKWRKGYGVDVYALEGGNSDKQLYSSARAFNLQQLYFEVSYRKIRLMAGAKEMPMEAKNDALSSGAQTFGINARPIPQIRISLPDYWEVPLTRGWVHIKGFFAYGMTMDSSWQKNFTADQSRWTSNALYHAKAGYLRIKDSRKNFPLSFDLGIEMACTFGGTSHQFLNGERTDIKCPNNAKAFWQALIPGGSDATDGEGHANVGGNHLGSWMIRANYDTRNVRYGLYIDKFFEDHSQMFFTDFDGYGEKEEWQKTKRHRFYMYDFRDVMLGAEVELKKFKPISNVVVEYIYSKFQSGPIFHDHTYNISDHLGGRDNYYNHNIYTGWQYFGYTVGNPFYRSPLYNTNGVIQVENNRFHAVHLGVRGEVTDRLSYRLRSSFQQGFGTYDSPYLKPLYNTSFAVDATYKFAGKFWNNVRVNVAVGADFGKIIGNNLGGQLTIKYSGKLL